MRLTSVEKIPGQRSTRLEDLNYEINVSLFRLAFKYPPSPGDLILQPTLTPCLSSAGGTYTSNPGLAVTTRVHSLLTP
jgi:hypothetical protein